MAQVQVNGITLEYEISGPETGMPLLMIHGVGAQLIRWPRSLCDKLAEAGFRLLRYDSRDIGLSTHMNDAPVPNLAAVTAARLEGREPELPYTLADLAADAAGLLAAAGIPAAHVVGVSIVAWTRQPSWLATLPLILAASSPLVPATVAKPATPSKVLQASREFKRLRGE